MAAKKKTGIAALQAKAAQAQANADNVLDEPSDDYLADITDAIKQETAFMKRPNKPYDFSTKLEFLGAEREFYWKIAGAGVAGNYIQELADANVGGLFVGLVFYRCVNPKNGERLFTDPEFKQRLHDDPDLSMFVSSLGAQIFESDTTREERLKAKRLAAKKK